MNIETILENNKRGFLKVQLTAKVKQLLEKKSVMTDYGKRVLYKFEIYDSTGNIELCVFADDGVCELTKNDVIYIDSCSVYFFDNRAQVAVDTKKIKILS